LKKPLKISKKLFFNVKHVFIAQTKFYVHFEIMKLCQNHLNQLILSPQPPPDDTLTITPPPPSTTNIKRRLRQKGLPSLLSEPPCLPDVEKPATPPPLPDRLIPSPQLPPDDTLTITPPPPSPTNIKRREKPATPPPLPDRGKRVRVRPDNSPKHSDVPLSKRARNECIKPARKKPAAPSARARARPAVVSSDEEDIDNDDVEVDIEEAPIRLRRKPYVPRKDRAIKDIDSALNRDNYNLFPPSKKPVR